MSNDQHAYEYDLLVIGGGSGGIATAKRASTLYGAKVGVIEKGRLGGTCVNVGCVPKKVMYNAAHMAHTLSHDALHYGFDGGRTVAQSLDVPKLKMARDAHVSKLNGIYERGLKAANVEYIHGMARLMDHHSISVESNDDDADRTPSNPSTNVLTAKYILIATGGRPKLPTTIEGVTEHCITSDGFFDLESLPAVAVLVGAGYIAVELAGILNALGVEVHLVVRNERALLRRGGANDFDEMVSIGLDEEMIRAGIHIHRYTQGVARVTVASDEKTKIVTTVSGDTIYGANVVIMAVGRVPNVEGIGLDRVGVTLTEKGYIQVDDYQNTSCDSILALGDVCGDVELTPMAIAAGRRLADRLFGENPTSFPPPKVSYANVPTVIFSHPPIGAIGLSESKARETYGSDNIKVYKSSFANLFYGIFDVDASEKPKTRMKVICAGETEKVVGIHCIGMNVDEMMQGFGVAMKMGCTKADLDSCVAIHPTASEELVTMGVWGTSPPFSGASDSPLHGADPTDPIIPNTRSNL